MLSRVYQAVVLAGLLSLGGCVTTGVSLSDYSREVELERADRLPTEADLNAQGRAKVVVFETDDGNLDKARRSQAATTLTREVEDMLGNNGAEVVDRSIAGRLGQELQLAEVKGVGNYEGPAVANYAVKPTITLADYVNEFTPASSYVGKDGKVYNNPASWNHKASINISVRIYEIPSLRQVRVLAGKGRKSRSTSDQGSHDLAISLLRDATQDALKDVQSGFLNQFAPKGYVLGKRQNGDKASLFRISIGSDQGITSDVPVVIYTEKESIHPITKKTRYDKIPVVEGKVSKIVTASEAWVIPGDEDKARAVRMGDQVEVVYKDSGWTNFMRKLK